MADKHLGDLLSFVRDYSSGQMSSDRRCVYVVINFNWESTSFTSECTFQNLQGKMEPLEESLPLRDVHKLLLKGKEKTKIEGLTKWNLIQCQFDSEGNFKHSVSWSEPKVRHVQYDLEDEIEAGINEPDVSKKLIIRDVHSRYSLKPFYYINRPEVGIKPIVKQMIEEGSELDMVDFDLIDFNQPKWKELDDLVVARTKEDSQFRMMLDGDWDNVKRRFTTAKFTYIFNGHHFPFDIPL